MEERRKAKAIEQTTNLLYYAPYWARLIGYEALI